MDRSSVDNKRFAIVADTYLQFPGEQVPLKAKVGNLSQSGMFLISEITYPAGTDFNFRITAERPEDTITGRGRVAWRRQVAAGQHRPPGMGCQILRLTDDSRDALERRLDASSQFEIMREPPDTRSLTQEFSRQSVQETLVTQQINRPEYFQTASPSAAKRPTGLLPGILAALAILIALGVGAWALRSGKLVDLDAPEAPVEASSPAGVARSSTGNPGAGTDSPSPPQESNDNSAETATESVSTQPIGTPSVSPQPGGSTNPAPAAAASPLATPAQADQESATPSAAQALDTVRSWAAAWSDQDPDRYLSYYAPAFTPDNGASRSAWAASRRLRLRAPRFVRVEIENLEFRGNAERAVVSFQQRYRSDTFSDLVEKELSLQVVDDAWKIVGEVSRPLS